MANKALLLTLAACCRDINTQWSNLWSQHGETLSWDLPSSWLIWKEQWLVEMTDIDKGVDPLGALAHPGHFLVPCDAAESYFFDVAIAAGRKLRINQLTNPPTTKPAERFRNETTLNKYKDVGGVLRAARFFNVHPAGTEWGMVVRKKRQEKKTRKLRNQNWVDWKNRCLEKWHLKHMLSY